MFIIKPIVVKLTLLRRKTEETDHEICRQVGACHFTNIYKTFV